MFIYSEKVTKILRNLHLFLTGTPVKKRWRFRKNFVVFSEYMNFNSISTRKDRLEWPPYQYWNSQISEPSNRPAFKEHMLLSSLASAVFWKNPCMLILFSVISILGSFHTYCVSRWFTKKILGVLVAVECFEVFKSLRLKVTQQWLLSQPQGRKAKRTSLHQNSYGAASCSIMTIHSAQKVNFCW